ncbi:MAG: hypothetical protein IPG45_16430 [Deltaproteobacteria bacterium]|jgi:hypothetical protein|nr:hypothetical protein [Deltaproteobacteria bacterium]
MDHRWPPLLALCTALACDAEFTDLRPAPLQVAFDVDGGFVDTGPLPTSDVVYASGPMAPRGSYSAAGTASLVIRSTGALELELDEGFRVSGVPGPVVVLSRRASIGRRIDPELGDVELGTLEANSGLQRYPIPSHALDASYAWVYCRPFGVEIARAVLERVP